jgi:hypothetical protein
LEERRAGADELVAEAAVAAGDEGDGAVDPHCRAAVWVTIGERGFFSTSEDHALSDDGETLPLHPADPVALDGLGRRLHQLSLTDGHEDVAHALTCAFGEATCPRCEKRFSVVGQVAARSS